MPSSFARAIRDLRIQISSTEIKTEQGISSICQNYAKDSWVNRTFYAQSQAAARNILVYIAQLQNQVSSSHITDENAAYLLFNRIFSLGKSAANPNGLDPYGFVCRGIWVELADVMLREFTNLGTNYLPIQDDFRSLIEPVDPLHAYSNPISQGLCDAVRAAQQILYAQMRNALNHLLPAAAAPDDHHTETDPLITRLPDGEVRYLNPE